MKCGKKRPLPPQIGNKPGAIFVFLNVERSVVVIEILITEKKERERGNWFFIPPSEVHENKRFAQIRWGPPPPLCPNKNIVKKHIRENRF